MFESLNIVPIILAVVADMVVSTLWYSPFLFGNYWRKETGTTRDDMKGAAKSMSFAVIASFVMAVVLAIVLDKLNVKTVDGAIETAFMLWVGFVLTTNVTRIIYERAKPSVYFLQVSYQLVGLIVMSIILVLWK